MKNVVILTTYPIHKPYHGGQHRVSQLAKAYERAGLKITPISIFEPEGYKQEELGINDIPFYSDSKYRLYKNCFVSLITDLLSARFVLNDEHAKNRLIDILKKNPPDYIHFEHPWLFDVARFVKDIWRDRTIKLIFGSANIEHILKGKIFDDLHIEKTKNIKDILQSIRKLEIQAANESDVTLVVSESDRTWFKKNTKVKDILLIPNGVPKMVEKEYDIDSVRREIGAERYFLFVASAHPPNMEGFKDFIGDSLACLPPNVKLVIAGSVAEHIVPYLVNCKNKFLNESRIYNMGKVEQEKLEATIRGSHAIIVPISNGGGTNLKTAEAIYSGKHVIVSERGFRGYGEYINIAGVWIVKTKEKFRETMRLISQTGALKRNVAGKEACEKVTWEYITTPLINYIDRLGNI